RVASAELAAVVGVRWVAGAATRIERLSAGRAVALLTRASVARARGSAADFARIVDLAVTVPCFELVFAELDAAVRELERAFVSGSSVVARARIAGAEG